MKDEKLRPEKLQAEMEHIPEKEGTMKELSEADSFDCGELMQENGRILSGRRIREGGKKEPKQELPEKRAGNWIGDIAFYLFLIVLVVSVAFLKGGNNGAPKSLAGFSAFTVLTGSMQDEIPQGSLVITRQTIPQDLKIGDDITYLSSPTTTVTHRIVGIIENYQNTGQRAFETQGIMNAKPDEQPVPAGNVVGKVIFHSYELGRMFTILSENWLIFLVLLVLIAALIKTLKIVFRRD